MREISMDAERHEMEPAAVMWVDSTGCEHVTTDVDRGKVAAAVSGYDVIHLYAAPPPPAAAQEAVAVKALEWDHRDRTFIRAGETRSYKGRRFIARHDIPADTSTNAPGYSEFWVEDRSNG